MAFIDDIYSVILTKVKAKGFNGAVAAAFMAQLGVETGWGTSVNFKTRNNVAGIRGASVTSSNPKGYRSYSSVAAGIEAYFGLIDSKYASFWEACSSNNPYNVAKAMGNSPWAASRYRLGADGTDDASGDAGKVLGKVGTEGEMLYPGVKRCLEFLKTKDSTVIVVDSPISSDVKTDLNSRLKIKLPLVLGDSGPDVAVLEKFLNVPESKRTGKFGTFLQYFVLGYQVSKKLPPTGKWTVAENDTTGSDESISISDFSDSVEGEDVDLADSFRGKKGLIKNGFELYLPDVTLRYKSGSKWTQKQVPESTASIAKVVDEKFGGFLSSIQIYRDASRCKGSSSCHCTNRALDLMTGDKDVHNIIVTWALNNAASYDIRYIISFRRVWSVKNSFKLGYYSGESAHTDHVHLSVACTG